MPVTQQTPVISYTASGSSTVFAYPYRILAATDLVVTLNDLITTVGFTVSGVGSSTGGSVTFTVPPSAGTLVKLQRSIPRTRSTDYVEGGPLRADTLDSDFDRIVMMLQDVEAGVPITVQNYASEIKVSYYTATQGQTVFALIDPYTLSANTLELSVNGAEQIKDADYTETSTSSVTFLTALNEGDTVQARVLQVYPGVVATAALVGFQQSGAGSAPRTVEAKLFERVSVLDFIPVSEHAAIKAGTSTLDVTTYFNAALAVAKTVYVPSGQYRITRPINMTGRRVAFSGDGRHLVGESAGTTVINAYTGNYPIVDMTGTNTGLIQGINFRSDNPPAGFSPADCASIGVLQRRGAVTQTCHQPRLIDVRFNMTSAMARNGGIGTIGILNVGAEHTVTDHTQVLANMPLVEQNVLSFATSNPSDLPTYGSEYEQPYAGSPVSCTIHEHRSLMLISYDSFRAMWLDQIANVTFSNLYTSTRKLVSSAPAYSESFKFTSVANVTMDCYQETSGVFGSTYRMDHRYLTLSGDNETIVMRVQRGPADVGFTIPGAAEPSVVLLNGAYLANSDINCNYTVGTYNASGDNNGFAALPVTFTGTPNALKNVKLTLDHSGSHSAEIFTSLRPYCTNVQSVNYLSGDRALGEPVGTFTVTMAGSTSAGVGSGVTQSGRYRKADGMLHLTFNYSCSGHTGTGDMQFSGFPFTFGSTAVGSVFYQATTMVGAGRTAVAVASAGANSVYLWASDPAGGGGNTVAVDPTTNVIISISVPLD